MLKKLFSCISVLAITLMLVPSSFASSGTATGSVTAFSTSVDILDLAVGTASVQVSYTLSQDATIHLYAVKSDLSKTVDIITTANKPVGTYTDSYWLGREGNLASGAVLPTGTYVIKLDATGVVGHGEKEVTLAPMTLSSFNVPTTFEPAPAGNPLIMTYALSRAADGVNLNIRDANNNSYKTFVASNDADKISGTVSWDGKSGLNFVDPGTYTAYLTATKSGQTDVTSSKTFTVSYSNTGKSLISNVALSATSFDPNFDDLTVSFTNSKYAKVTVEIWTTGTSPTAVRTFSDFDGDFYNAGQNLSVVWNGQNSSGNIVSTGTYTVKIKTENDYGVSVDKQTVTVTNSGGTTPAYNAHISNITFSPSTTFEPLEDEELKIRFDVLMDIDSLTVYATQGATKIKLYDETTITQQNRLEILWDGTNDNDDHVAKGTWRILFTSKKGTTELRAVRSINIDYVKPKIDELQMTKTKFDNEAGEFTNVMFKLDEDADVDVIVVQGGSDDDFISEDMEVEKDKWYAVEWDGGSYDYSDSLDIKLVAKNKANPDIYDTKKISVDLAEDTTSTSKANVTNDYISPVLTSGYDEMTISYNIDDDADVTVSILKGATTSGSEVIKLLNSKSQSAGDHELTWDGKNSNGNRLSTGFYTYKITSKKSSTDVETGIFVVGTVGNIEGSASESGSSSTTTNNNGTISSHVIVDGGDSGTTGGVTTDCGFSDLPSNSTYCAAAAWAKQEGIFEGYADGSFKPYQAINRAELLKVVLEALGFTILPSDGTNLGYKDVQTNAWYMPYIKSAGYLGIFVGDAGKNTARPADTVNRAETLKMIFTALSQAMKYSPAACAVNYPDVAAGAWYYSYACAAYENNLFDGSLLQPATLSTRGEVAQLLYKLSEKGIW